MKKEVVCINCPKGCRIEVEIEDKTISILCITGNDCQRGISYATQEILSPMRILTGNMKARGCQRPFSVISDAPIPKKMLYACAMELKRYHPIPPIAIDDIVIKNILNTGCNIIATQNFFM